MAIQVYHRPVAERAASASAETAQLAVREAAVVAPLLPARALCCSVFILEQERCREDWAKEETEKQIRIRGCRIYSSDKRRIRG
jgi:hypothetical protein